MRIAIIPARSGSSRIKDKNIHPLCGRPLLSYSLAAARDSGLFDKIHLSTDSPAYAQIAEEAGFLVDFLRPKELAQNESSLMEVLRSVLNTYAERGEVYEELCLLYPTAPLVEGVDLQEGHRLFRQDGGRIPLLTVGVFPSPLERAMHIGDDGILNWAAPENRHLHSQHCQKAYYDAGAFFFVRRDVLEADRQDVLERFRPFVLPPWKAVDINEPEDLALAERLYLGRSRMQET